MFDIQCLMSEWHDKGAILLSGLKYVLKQGMKIVGQLEMGEAGYLLTCPRISFFFFLSENFPFFFFFFFGCKIFNIFE